MRPKQQLGIGEKAVLSGVGSESIEQVQQLTDAWLIEYNEERPHDALGRVRR